MAPLSRLALVGDRRSAVPGGRRHEQRWRASPPHASGGAGRRLSGIHRERTPTYPGVPEWPTTQRDVEPVERVVGAEKVGAMKKQRGSNRTVSACQTCWPHPSLPRPPARPCPRRGARPQRTEGDDRRHGERGDEQGPRHRHVALLPADGKPGCVSGTTPAGRPGPVESGRLHPAVRGPSGGNPRRSPDTGSGNVGSGERCLPGGRRTRPGPS